jgi:transcription elongation GreA/GreB family factor/very-short-patch-repair endonuclease
VPEIIQFSNHLSYKTIVPLREPHSAPVKPAMVAHRVNGFRDERGKTNEVEAEEIASLVIACIGEPDYARNDFGQATSFGVISLLGDEQALVIENILRMRLSPDVFAKHRLLCGNAAQFQGDERDVVFLSMVDGPPDDGQLSFRDAGPKDLYKKRYNVAVSRARNQLWVVHSIDPDTHLKGGDLRRRLIEHARDPQALMRAMEEQGKRTDSVFEKLVLQRLISAGYRVHPQWPVGARRIDLVVEGKTKRLAVECDGERWHTPEQLHQDLERQSILERLGWIFVRIRGSVFFRDPDAAMAPVFAKLNYLEIEPLGAAAEQVAVEPTPLIQRIKRRAEVIRAQWAAERRAKNEEEDDISFEAEQPKLATTIKAQELVPEVRVPASSPRQVNVQVGDSVKYFFVDDYNNELYHMIVEGDSNPSLGLLSKDDPVAQALLGMDVDAETSVRTLTGARRLRVMKIDKPKKR